MTLSLFLSLMLHACVFLLTIHMGLVCAEAGTRALQVFHTSTEEFKQTWKLYVHSNSLSHRAMMMKGGGGVVRAKGGGGHVPSLAKL